MNIWSDYMINVLFDDVMRLWCILYGVMDMWYNGAINIWRDVYGLINIWRMMSVMDLLCNRNIAWWICDVINVWCNAAINAWCDLYMVHWCNQHMMQLTCCIWCNEQYGSLVCGAMEMSCNVVGVWCNGCMLL